MSQCTSWRFLSHAPYTAAENMAIDEALLEAVLSGESPPVLRLYAFVPAAVTIGLSQRMNEQALETIRAAGCDIVRRPTGGRAVLHSDDLTYAFIAPDVSLPGGFLNTGVTESYRQICQGLIAAFAELGIESELGQTGVQYRHLQDCFMATTNSDLHHGGIKLIGSAQVRRRGAVLQHGSVPLQQEQGLMARLLGEGDPDYQRHVNLFDLAARELAIADLENAFRCGFEKAFGITFADSELTDGENFLVQEIVERYQRPVLAASNVAT